MARERLMMLVPVPESFPEFDERHGGKRVRAGKWWLWPDGARANYETNQRDEPPEDTMTMYERQLDFCRTKLAACNAEYEAVRNHFVQQAEWATMYDVPSAPANAPEILKGMREQIAHWEDELATVLASLKELTPNELPFHPTGMHPDEVQRRQALLQNIVASS